MKIDGITVCVGRRYCDLFARTAPYWLATLDSLTIVTKPDDAMFRCPPPHANYGCEIKIVATEAFAANGAHFNKGAALNHGYSLAAPRHWVLAFDADMQPPHDWRRRAEAVAIAGNLYGARRSNRRHFEPFGYFQLFHAHDPAVAAPPFAECYGHAGRYDKDFLERWPANRRVKLPFRLSHLGEPAKHWHGEGNEHLTAALLRDGVAAYRERDEKLPVASLPDDRR